MGTYEGRTLKFGKNLSYGHPVYECIYDGQLCVVKMVEQHPHLSRSQMAEQYGHLPRDRYEPFLHSWIQTKDKGNEYTVPYIATIPCRTTTEYNDGETGKRESFTILMVLKKLEVLEDVKVLKKAAHVFDSNLVEETTKCLHFLHSINVRHMDVKIQQWFYDGTDPDRKRILIGDFGNSTYITTELTQEEKDVELDDITDIKRMGVNMTMLSY